MKTVEAAAPYFVDINVKLHIPRDEFNSISVYETNGHLIEYALHPEKFKQVSRVRGYKINKINGLTIEEFKKIIND